jgi:hypothetical protein
MTAEQGRAGQSRAEASKEGRKKVDAAAGHRGLGIWATLRGLREAGGAGLGCARVSSSDNKASSREVACCSPASSSVDFLLDRLQQRSLLVASVVWLMLPPFLHWLPPQARLHPTPTKIRHKRMHDDRHPRSSICVAHDSRSFILGTASLISSLSNVSSGECGSSGPRLTAGLRPTVNVAPRTTFQHLPSPTSSFLRLCSRPWWSRRAAATHRHCCPSARHRRETFARTTKTAHHLMRR